MLTEHYALYFTSEHVLQARNAREQAPFKAAWEHLQTAPLPPGIGGANRQALRYCLLQDDAAGQAAATWLQGAWQLPEKMPRVAAVAAAHTYEMLRDRMSDAWRADFAAQIDALPPAQTPLETLWQCTLDITAGIVLEDNARFERGVQAFRRAIDEQIHPEGYVKSAVENPKGRTMWRQMRSVCALALAAEAATHAGENLWGYEHRGVSVVTAATYLIYYYFYPEKWQWEDGYTPEDTQALYAQHGAFLEMVYARAPLRDFELIFKERRPLEDVYSGGLTTLTHGQPTKRRGFFRR